MPKFYAKTQVLHDATLFVPGQPLNIPDAAAQKLYDGGYAMTEDEMKQASAQKDAVDAQAATISQKDAEIAALRSQLDAAKAGAKPSEPAK